MDKTVLYPARTFLLFLFLCSHMAGMGRDTATRGKRAALAGYITSHYATQLTDPEKEKRKSLSQFGYGLYYYSFFLFPVTEFIDPHDFGVQSYGKPGIKEKNGSLYTCRGGFMDFSHIRAAADWTVFLTFMIITRDTDFALPPHTASLQLHFRHLHDLSTDDIVAMAQKIAYERLVWHEVASWYYHAPNFTFNEQESTFTPEDSYSDFLGTVVGRNVALRILNQKEGLSYEQITTEEIQKVISSLGPMDTKKQSKDAYDIVDRYKQLKLPPEKRNPDIWWDSEIGFNDERFVFKRYINLGPQLPPWLVPGQELLGCSVKDKPYVLSVPQKTKAGKSLYDYYEFSITPDPILFFDKLTKKQLAEPFAPFTTKNFQVIIDYIRKEMEKELLPGFDRRDKCDPVPYYLKLRKVIFK